jgi:hypothetical protein
MSSLSLSKNMIQGAIVSKNSSKMIYKMKNMDKEQKRIIDLCKECNISINCPKQQHLDNKIKLELIEICHKYLIRDLPYEKKHLEQEVAIIHKLIDIIDINNRKNSVVIDVGGGNGDLAYLIYNILNIQVVVVDPFINTKLIEYDYECDENKFSRIVDDIRNVDLNQFGNKDIYIVCKHLCGTNLDIALDKIINNPSIKGFCVCPCCYHRGLYNDFIGKSILCQDNFKLITSVVDWKDIQQRNTPAYDLGCTSENIINSIRMNIIKRRMNVKYTEYVDSKITPKNTLLFGSVINLKEDKDN